MIRIVPAKIRDLGSLGVLVLALLLPLAGCGGETSDGTAQSSTPDVQPAGAEASEAAAAPATVPDFEDPPVFEAKEVLNAELYQGPHFRVDDHVQNDGAMNHFRIVSDYGEYEVEGRAEFVIRLHEIHAIAALKDVSSTEAVAEAAGQGAVGKLTGPVRGAKAVAHAAVHPDETWGHLKNVGSGAMRVFRGASDRVQESAHDVAGSVTGDQDVAAAGGDVASRHEETAGRFGRWFTGYSKGEMALMQELDVDPYTDNEILRHEIHRVAGLQSAVKTGFRLFVPGIPGLHAFSVANKARNISYDVALYQEPGQLLRDSQAKANQMGIPPEVYARFSGNESYSPALLAVTVGAIHSMKGTKDQWKFFDQAATADDVASAHYFMMVAEQLAQIHRDEAPIVRLVAGVRIPAGLVEDGRVIVPLPVDYLAWSEDMATLFRDAKQRVRDEDEADVITYSELRIQGTVSERARAGFEAMDMKVVAGA